jgi:hypothetical protein
MCSSLGNVTTSLVFTHWFDDMVVADNSGSVNNDFIGNVRVIGLLPNGNGANSGFTRVGGTASGNYTAVDENPIDGDTSYVASPTVGTVDTYAYSDLPSSASQVLAVCAYPIVRKDDSGSRSIIGHVRSNGTEADIPGSTLALGANYGTARGIMTTNPTSGTPWSVTDVNNAEFGVKVSA